MGIINISFSYPNRYNASLKETYLSTSTSPLLEFHPKITLILKEYIIGPKGQINIILMK